MQMPIIMTMRTRTMYPICWIETMILWILRKPRWQSQVKMLENERTKSDKHNVNPWRIPKYAPDELIGKSFLMKTEDGQEVGATVVSKLNNRDAQNHQN